MASHRAVFGFFVEWKRRPGLCYSGAMLFIEALMYGVFYMLAIGALIQILSPISDAIDRPWVTKLMVVVVFLGATTALWFVSNVTYPVP